ncbi:MAG TPA: beta-ketoacyl synthase chain length factor [Burkholderiaceae bacterium]|nr:beta-ketoacyl synthase chain length factor [Burkholderiaceae bacterium]
MSATHGATLQVAVAGIGVLGPGLSDWPQAAGVLRTPSDWKPAATVVPAPQRLPAAERRRAGVGVRAALEVAEQACAMAGAAVDEVATVFASASGDPETCHAICEALARPERLLSPTRFTNSVHNAAAGYWHIAAQSRAASTSLAAYDASVAAGLLEAAAQCASSGAPVLLVASDMPYPAPLHALRPLPDVFACALLLAPPRRSAAWPLALRIASPGAPTRCSGTALDALRRAVPAARVLPLLQALAFDVPGTVMLDDDGFALVVQVAARA